MRVLPAMWDSGPYGPGRPTVVTRECSESTGTVLSTHQLRHRTENYVSLMLVLQKLPIQADDLYNFNVC